MNQPEQTAQSTRRNGEGLVVTEGGVRASGTVHQNESSANAEAAQLSKKRITEKTGSPTPQVKQQLFG